MMRHKNYVGFTLIELMIVVVIISILTMIAIPLYTQQVVKARRTDGKIALLDLAARMERYYAENHTFATATIATNPATDISTTDVSPEGIYDLSIVSNTATNFVLQAAPVPGSPQAADDTRCGSFRINQLGQKTITGTGTVAQCWG